MTENMTQTILIIDDEKPTLSMFRLFLGALGYTALIADSAEAGIEIFKKEKPGIVMTDIKMPGMDGFEVLQKIKAIDPNAQVILITGHGDVDLEKQAMGLDAIGFIHKPIQKEALQDALKRAQEKLKAVNP